MGTSKAGKLTILIAGTVAASMTSAWGLNTANNTTDFTKKVISKERVGYETPSQRNKGPLPGVPASASNGRPSMGSEGKSAMGRRYWSTPDEVRILKVRGDSGEATTLRENQDGKLTGRKVLPLMSWGNRRSPELAGWGPVHPYEAPEFAQEANYMYSILSKDRTANRSGVTSRPFDAGLTRYEMWVKKAGRPKAGWLNDAWFFNSYNVVSQGGDVLGEIKISTPDSLFDSTRTFRDAPYLIDATEKSGIMRAYSPSFNKDASVLTNSVSLVSQPKMLVLISPDISELSKNDYEAMSGSASANRVMREQRLRPKTYKVSPAPNSPLPPDLDRQLAPNVNINDAGPTEETAGAGSMSQNYKSTPLAKNWQYDSSNKTWHFRQWQRGEFLADNVPHTWILETKEDLLYAPQTTSSAIVDPNRITIVDPQTTAVTDIPSTVVATGQVNAFDTGGFRLAINDVMKTSEWGTENKVFNGIEGIPDYAAMNVAPVGYFYPDSRIIVALEYVLLKKVGNTLQEDGDWKTGKIHYWNSSNDSPDPLVAKEVTFDPAGGAFDPYVHGWIFPTKDVSHTSAKYRLRVFMALPFKPVALSSGKLPTGFESGEKVASTFSSREFGLNQMVQLLDANSKSPAILAKNDPMQTNVPYREALDRVSLSGVYGIPQNRVSPVSANEVERIVSGVTFSGSNNTLSVANIGEVKSPFGADETSWFEFVFDDAKWTVDVPEINVGLGPEGAGVIITE